MKARITVTLKAGVLDPQGQAIEVALGALGVEGVRGVRQGKVFDIILEEENEAQANETLQQICEKLLVNLVIENYQIDIEHFPKTGSHFSQDALVGSHENP